MQVIMRVELLYGMAGLVGSLVSGHLYPLLSSSLGTGTLLVVASIVVHTLSLLQAVILLRVSVSTAIADAWELLFNIKCCHLIVLNICVHSKRQTPFSVICLSFKQEDSVAFFSL